MKLEPRGRLLTEAVHAAAMELAKEASTPRYPAPQPARKPNPEDIRALAARTPITPETNTDELWSAAAISPEGNRHWGLGRTPSEASACAWAYSHWTDGSCSINIETLLNIPTVGTSSFIRRQKSNHRCLQLALTRYSSCYGEAFLM
jgi:hypothetical protein